MKIEKVSPEYLEAVLDVIRDYLPEEVFRDIQKLAIPKAGGKASAKKKKQEICKLTLEEMEPDTLEKISNAELRSAWLRLNQWYESAKQDKKVTEGFVNRGIWVSNEMEKRGFKLDKTTDFYKDIQAIKTRKETVLGIKGDIPAQLTKVFNEQPDEILMIRDFISIVGSSAVAENPDDLDVAIRADYDFENDVYKIKGSSLHVALRRFLDPQKERSIHFIDSPAGPFTDYIPMFDLVFRKRNPYVERIEPSPPKYNHRGRVIKQEEAEKNVKLMIPFSPMKAKAGYHIGEFFSFPTLWTLWGRGKVERGKKIAVQEKFDGIRMVIHKRGNEVKIFTEDKKRERQDIFPEIVKEVQKLPIENTIIDTEFVWWKEGKPIPREEMLHFVSGKAPLIGEDIRVNIHDMLWAENRSFVNEGYEDRLKEIDKILKTDGKYLKKVPTKIANNEKELKAAIEWASEQEGSEGAMLKTLDSIYNIDGDTGNWAKIKKVLEIKVKVIGRRKKPSPWDKFPTKDLVGADAERALKNLTKDSKTWLYKIAILDGNKLKPVDAEKTLAPADLEIKWDSERKEWKGLENPSLWEFADNQYKRGLKDYELGTTYASNVQASLGDIITIQTVRVKEFEDKEGNKRITFMFPRVKEKDPTRTKPDTMKDIKRIIGLRKVEKIAIEELHADDTRAGQAERFWNKNWHEMYPKSGKGRFTYQHHYRGLSEEESKLNEKDLLNIERGVSVHGDLRLQKDNEELWGTTIFLGTAKDVKEFEGCRLCNLPKGDNLQVTFKLNQPIEWLDVGKEEPFVVEPMEVGATAKGYGKYFVVDFGEYEMGVWREHSIEIFLKGKDGKLKGRYILQYFPTPRGERVWIIDRPEEQTPMAQKKDKIDVIRELKRKGQKWLIWNDPTTREKPEKIDVQNYKIQTEEAKKVDRVKKEYNSTILKLDDSKRLVYGVVLEPNSIDAQEDSITEEEIEKACHYFMKSRVIGDRHKKTAQAELVESYLAPVDFTSNNQEVKKGSWIIAVKIHSDSLWKAVREGKYTGFSVGGYGTRIAT